MSVEYLKQQLGANEKILYTERHHWIFFVAEMVKWIIFAAAVLALIILLKVWLIPDAGWVWWLLLVFLVPAVRIAWGFLSWRMNIYVLSKRVADSSLEKRRSRAAVAAGTEALDSLCPQMNAVCRICRSWPADKTAIGGNNRQEPHIARAIDRSGRCSLAHDPRA